MVPPSNSLPLWLNPRYARLITKGNLMVLVDRPKTIEPGEWLAHQVVEQYRNLSHFVCVVHEKEADGASICNPAKCPTMSAGSHSYAWLNQDQEKVELSAHQYITLIQRWITAKIQDSALFPTDPLGAASAAFADAPQPDTAKLPNEPVPVVEGWLGREGGFPKQFAVICRLIFRHMFRVYAHLYWGHFVDFYHLSLEKELNSCFSNFVLVATTHGMLPKEDLQPMQGLVNIWAADGTFAEHSQPGQLCRSGSGRIPE